MAPLFILLVTQCQLERRKKADKAIVTEPSLPEEKIIQRDHDHKRMKMIKQYRRNHVLWRGNSLPAPRGPPFLRSLSEPEEPGGSGATQLPKRETERKSGSPLWT